MAGQIICPFSEQKYHLLAISSTWNQRIGRFHNSRCDPLFFAVYNQRQNVRLLRKHSNFPNVPTWSCRHPATVCILLFLSTSGLSVVGTSRKKWKFTYFGLIYVRVHQWIDRPITMLFIGSVQLIAHAYLLTASTEAFKEISPYFVFLSDNLNRFIDFSM